MRKLNISALLWDIRTKYIVPAIATRETLLFKYLATIGEVNDKPEAFKLYTSSGTNHILYAANSRSLDTPKAIYMFELPTYNQEEITKHLTCLSDLVAATARVKTYLSYLNNKSNSVHDIAYALPPHINQLVPMITPTEYLDHDLRDPQMYALLNELQIKLLLLS